MLPTLFIITNKVLNNNNQYTVTKVGQYFDKTDHHFRTVIM